MGMREHSFLSILLKFQIFILPKLRGMRGNRIRFNEFFTKTSKIPPYIQPFILKYRSNSNIVIKLFKSENLKLANHYTDILILANHFLLIKKCWILRPHLGGENEMEGKGMKKNTFKIFFPSFV